MKKLLNKSQVGAGAVVIILSILLGAAYYANVSDQQSKVKCQRAYNLALAETLKQRAGLLDQRVEAIDSLLTGMTYFVINPQNESVKDQTKKFVELFQAYNTSDRTLDEARASLKLPTLEQC